MKLLFNIHSPNQLRRTITQVARAVDQSEKVLPYKSIPGPKFINRAFLPGGECYNKPLGHIHQYFRSNYGSIVRIPGLLGRPDMVLTSNPEDYGTIFRNEGAWPSRIGFESLTYYRQKVRPDIFNAPGLLTS